MDSPPLPEAISALAPLFEPLTIRGLTIPNRVAMSPMTRSFCPDNLPGADVVGYYRRRAEGGAGLIITEAIGTDHPAAVGDTGLGEVNLPLFSDQRSADAWRNVADAVHDAGAKIIPQLWHQGPMRMPNDTAPAFSPSGYYGDPSKAAEYYVKQAYAISAAPMPVPTDEEIADVAAGFGRAAGIAMLAGVDGIALHGGHGYLIDSFLWSETNRRADRWGGDAASRTAFAGEVIRQVRAAIGEARPLIFRFSQWKQQDFRAKLAETPQELEAVLGPLADAGVDLFDASARYFNSPAFPTESGLSLAGWAKKLTGKLSGTVGGIGFSKGNYDSLETGAPAANNMDLILKRFADGEFDLVSVGRALLHDPAWVRKMRHGEPFMPFDPASLTQLT